MHFNFISLEKICSIGVLACLSGFAFSARSQEKPAIESRSEMLPADLLSISTTEAFSRFVFVVDKGQRKISVFEHQGESIRKIEDYPADIGKNDGNKQRRDDHRTPEGIYFLEHKRTPPDIPFQTYGKMAFTTNYPNLFDQLDGKTGSGIWLHSIPETVPLTRGSRGCVVVRNQVIEKLENYIKLGETPILIFDKVRYLSKEEHSKKRQEVRNFLDSWRKSWEARDVDQYMSFYDAKFTAPGFNYKTWKKHKSKLKSTYEYIRVSLAQPYILSNKDQLIVKTLQKYESNLHTDYGVKTIYARKYDSGYRIQREEWEEADEKGQTSSTTSLILQTNVEPAGQRNVSTDNY